MFTTCCHAATSEIIETCSLSHTFSCSFCGIFNTYIFTLKDIHTHAHFLQDLCSTSDRATIYLQVLDTLTGTGWPTLVLMSSVHAQCSTQVLDQINRMWQIYHTFTMLHVHTFLSGANDSRLWTSASSHLVPTLPMELLSPLREVLTNSRADL